MIQEEFIHYLWQHQLFNKKGLYTERGESIQIIHPGSLNRDSGPDFFNGQIKINDILWVGNIEIHIRSSDWFKHKHQNDRAYSKLILHVVWEHDREVIQQNGQFLEVLVLKGRVPSMILEQYHQLKNATSWVACAKSIGDVESIYINQMIDRMAIDRLEEKTNRLGQLLKLYKNDWEAVFYQMLARAFGFKVNAMPFELLAISTPIHLIRKYRPHLLKLQALIFGQAGFLDKEQKDDYHKRLMEEYQLIKHLHKLESIDASLWKFMRMRPANFPTVRLAQFANLLYRYSSLFREIQNTTSVKALRELFSFPLDQYWQEHYQFGRNHKGAQLGGLGDRSIDMLIINVVVPLIYAWQKAHSREAEEVIQILKQLNAEENSILRKWRDLNVCAETAFDSQALLQLKHKYCSNGKCLDCSIGNHILKGTTQGQQAI